MKLFLSILLFAFITLSAFANDTVVRLHDARYYIYSNPLPYTTTHELKVSVIVKNYDYRKVVQVYYNDPASSTWQIANARFDQSLSDNEELWIADIKRDVFKFLLGDFSFAVKYTAGGQEYWDNNLDENFKIIPEYIQ
jgi:hypothetical protein